MTFSRVEYPLPADWKKQLPQTEWDRTNRWPLIGPQTPQMWQSLKSGIVYAGIGEHFRISGNSITLTPPPSDGLLIGFEYLSKIGSLALTEWPSPHLRLTTIPLSTTLPSSCLG